MSLKVMNAKVDWNMDSINENEKFYDGINDWIVTDISCDGFRLSVDGDCVWEESIDIDIDNKGNPTLSKQSGGIKDRKYDLEITDEEYDMCINILNIIHNQYHNINRNMEVKNYE